MKKSPIDRVLVEFSKPDNTNTVIVSRILPDNSTEPIGCVSPYISNGDDSQIYVSTNKMGEEIIPPTADFIEIENQFKKYAKELAGKSFEEDMISEAERLEEREKSITNIRSWKIKNRKVQQIIK